MKIIQYKLAILITTVLYIHQTFAEFLLIVREEPLASRSSQIWR